jgi:hypothetical protein
MQRQAQGVLVGVAGLSLGVVQVAHAFTGTATAIGFVFNAIPFVLMALAITYVGYWVTTAPDLGEHTSRVSLWAAGSAIGFAAVSALTVFSVNVAVADFPVFASAQHIATDTVTAGTLAGLLVGIYDARSQTRQVELEHQRDRIEAYANRAADVNNYGRALNQSDSIEEVSALCVEAVATLVGFHDTAFVERRGEFATLMDNTIVGVDDAVVAELAGRGGDAEQATVTTHTEDLPAALPTDVESVVTILVTETRGATITIVSLNRGERVEEETITLLEMLVSHAATALENLYRTSVDDSREGTSIEIENTEEE